MLRALEAVIDKDEVPVVRPSCAPVQVRPSSAPHLERGSNDEWREDTAANVGSAQGAVVANEEREDQKAKKLRKGKRKWTGEHPAEDLLFIGRNVRMLKRAKMWSVGDIFTITGSCLSGRSWRIGRGLYLHKDLEGTQWEWEASPMEAEEAADRIAAESCEASLSDAHHYERRDDTAATVGSVQGAVVANEEGEDKKAKKLKKGREKGRKKQPADDLRFIGCNVRMLKRAKMWSVGDIFRITGSCASGSSWRIDGGLLLHKDLEGTQWEWETSPVEAEEAADRIAAESCEASLSDDHAVGAEPQQPIAKRQKIRHAIQEANTGYDEP